MTIELVKQPGRTLGFSIAGGRGSTPAYEDVDEVCLHVHILTGVGKFPLHVVPGACLHVHCICIVVRLLPV